MPDLPLDIPQDKLEALCKKWKITELALFGSVLRDDFGPESDVDVLVTFDPSARIGLIELSRLQDELSQLIGRTVDVVSRRGVEMSRNPRRREEILSSARVLYAA